MNAYAKNAYAASMVNNSTSPLDLVILLYDGAIERLRKATFFINRGDVPGKLHSINGAMAIIEELLASLNVEQGGEVAGNLQGLYIFMMKELTEANLNNDASKVKHAEGLLKELRDAWRQVRLPVETAGAKAGG